MDGGPTRMFVTTDAVAVSHSPAGQLRLLLIRRGGEPFEGLWALPGGFVEEEEDLPDACARELEEETGVRAAALAQIGAWGTPGRDPRGRNVSVSYLAAVRADAEEPGGADDAAEARWQPAHELPPLAFDHAEIVAAGLTKLRLLALSTHFAFAMLPERFRLRDLRAALSAVLEMRVSFEQAATVAEAALLETVEARRDDEPALYRCTAADHLLPLRERAGSGG